MNEETNKHIDQAEHLKQLFNDVQKNEETQEIPSALDTLQITQDRDLKIDILNLPPRKDVHGKNAYRMRLKISRPFMRFLSVMITLVLIIIFIYFNWPDELKSLMKHLK